MALCGARRQLSNSRKGLSWGIGEGYYPGLKLRALLGEGPDVGLLLEVDRQYREQAGADQLPMIAPRRFNPENRAWLPVLHTERGDWHFTAMYSNTARAHELKRTRDWVVVYFYDDHHREGQCTVVTETRGPLTGQRVVRGQEMECREYYRQVNVG